MMPSLTKTFVECDKYWSISKDAIDKQIRCAQIITIITKTVKESQCDKTRSIS